MWMVSKLDAKIIQTTFVIMGDSHPPACKKFKAADGSSREIKHIDPVELYFTHDTISNSFHSGLSLQTALDDLINQKDKVSDYPALDVCQINNRYFAFRGNRRLALFKLYRFCGNKFKVQCRILSPQHINHFSEKLTTKYQGDVVMLKSHGALTNEFIGYSPCMTGFKHLALQKTCVSCNGLMQLVPPRGSVKRLCLGDCLQGKSMCHATCLEKAQEKNNLRPFAGFMNGKDHALGSAILHPRDWEKYDVCKPVKFCFRHNILPYGEDISGYLESQMADCTDTKMDLKGAFMGLSDSEEESEVSQE